MDMVNRPNGCVRIIQCRQFDSCGGGVVAVNGVSRLNERRMNDGDNYSEVIWAPFITKQFDFMTQIEKLYVTITT